LENPGWGIQVWDLQRRAESHSYFYTYTYRDLYAYRDAESYGDPDCNAGSNGNPVTHAASFCRPSDGHGHGGNSRADRLRNGESGL
jgi:hypothetical protein